MANNLEEIEVINNITWQDLVENNDLLKLDTKYEYPLDSGNLTPDVDYPAGNLHLGTCVDPNSGRSYAYDVILLGNYSSNTAEYAYDENGNNIDIGKVLDRAVSYALFYHNPDVITEQIFYTLVKATDKINDGYDYVWFPVATKSTVE